MSDKGSIRAGYRRSRMEPVDPTTISAPPPAVSPNGETRPPSTGPKKDDSGKESIFKKICRVLFLFLNIVFMAFAIMMLITGVVLWIIFREAGLSIVNVAGGLPLILIINGIFLIMFSMWGCEIALVSGRHKTILYLVALAIMFGFSIFAYVRSARLADSIRDNLNEYWGTFSANTRSMIQDFGNCCGLNGPIDYPALPCPEGTRTGCYQAFTDMQSSVSKISSGFLGGSIISFLLIAGCAAYLGFSGDGTTKNDDVESNQANNSASEPRKEIDSSSPI